MVLRFASGSPTPASAVRTQSVVLAPAGAAPVSDGPSDPGQLLVVGNDRAPFSRGDVVRRIKAQSAQVTKAAQLLALEAGAQGVAGILDDEEAPFFGQLHDLIHLTGVAQGVGHEESLCALGYGVFQGGDIEVVGA